MRRPTIALCIPAYNAEAYLPRLLKSAQKQFIPFDDILVYNDCSTDDTAEVAKTYGARVIGGDTNMGCSVGKNRMMESTQCDWIHFHDADDELLPNFTTLAHRWIAKPEVPDIVLFNYEWRDNDTSSLIGIRKFDRVALERDPISYAILEQINPFCGLYRRSKISSLGGYDTDPRVLYNEDVAFHCKMAINGCSFSSEDEISIINYRVSTSMSSTNAQKCLSAQYEVLKKCATNVGEKYSKEIVIRLWKIAGLAASLSDWRLADMSLSLAILLNGRYALGQSLLFRILAFFTPYGSLRIREFYIRLFKSYLRNG